MHKFNNNHRNVRVSIFNSYKRIEPHQQVPTSTNIAEIIRTTNSPYCNRNNGLFYADDYMKIKSSSEYWTTITGLSNNFYWDNYNHDCFFKINDGVKPSEALKAFFIGPSFPDCANVIQASVYLSILNTIGESKFDKIFGNKISQFIITKYLYDEFSSTSNENPIGNPLHFIFDKIDTNKMVISDLCDGDILHIGGVDDYKYKHLSGFAIGWNVVCIRKDINDEPKFIGFGPETFNDGPLTFSQLKLKLIEYYNQPQSKETLEVIKKLSLTNPVTDEERLNNQKSDLAKILANDTKEYDSDINGLICCIRLNQAKLNHFINSDFNNTWPTKLSNPQKNFEGSNIVKYLTIDESISSENRNSTFENYNTDNVKRKKLYELMSSFSNAVIEHDFKRPLGIILSGNPGIGKTHLSISVLKKTLLHSNKRILFLDEKFLNEYYQFNVSKYNISKEIKDFDFIIFDDINQIHGAASCALEEIFKEVFLYNKILLVSSNINLNLVYRYIPRYISYIDDVKNNFIVVDNLNINSYRSGCFLTKHLNTDRKLEVLSNFNQQIASGVVIPMSDIDRTRSYNMIKEQYCKIKEHCKIRMVNEPYKNQFVYDLYVKDANKFDTFIIKVTNQQEGEQLLKLIEKVHYMGSKIIVITDNESNFIKSVKYHLNSFLEKKYFDKRSDRLKVIFPDYF